MKLFNSKLLLSVSIPHAFTCKNSHNLAFHVGDDEHNVINNHKVLASQLKYNHGDLIHMRQLHSNKVVQVDAINNFKTPIECDAIITNRINTPLMVMVADCTPVLLYDKSSHAIAAIHAGRAGAFSNIIKNTIAMMHQKFNTKTDTIIAVLGPSICQNCYEVNHTIYCEAKELGYEKSILQKEGKYFLHVNHILEMQLKEAGVKEENIETLKHCTSCESETFYSYRAENGMTGRQAGVILLDQS
ncbi:MAG: peptidoglycan editing factor PgeF [Campylobacterota bacterium]|nr:peptidoglycan editing factor PgeF [Campylobacterota bacterium]